MRKEHPARTALRDLVHAKTTSVVSTVFLFLHLTFWIYIYIYIYMGHKELKINQISKSHDFLKTVHLHK